MSAAAVTAVPTGPTSGWVLTTDHLHRTEDGGATWTTTSVPRLRPGEFAAGRLFVDGATARLLTISDDGEAVVTTVEAAGPRSASVGRHPGATTAWVAFADSLHGWVAVGEPTRAPAKSSTVYSTTDGGLSWRSLGLKPIDGPLHPIDATSGYALGSRLWRTDDAGTTWHGEQPPPPAAPDLPPRFTALSLFGRAGVLEVKVPTGMMGYAVFDVTQDGGRSWESRKGPSEAAFSNTGPPLTLAVTDVDRWHISVGRRVWGTTDAGRHWQEQANDLPTRGIIVDLSFTSYDQAWAVIADPGGPQWLGSVLASDDGGSHWVPLKVPTG
jgi:photosystem II stability/assembly factor-like uncharacterized protein